MIWRVIAHILLKQAYRRQLLFPSEPLNSLTNSGAIMSVLPVHASVILTYLRLVRVLACHAIVISVTLRWA